MNDEHFCWSCLQGRSSPSPSMTSKATIWWTPTTWAMYSARLTATPHSRWSRSWEGRRSRVSSTHTVDASSLHTFQHEWSPFCICLYLRTMTAQMCCHVSNCSQCLSPALITLLNTLVTLSVLDDRRFGNYYPRRMHKLCILWLFMVLFMETEGSWQAWDHWPTPWKITQKSIWKETLSAFTFNHKNHVFIYVKWTSDCLYPLNQWQYPSLPHYTDDAHVNTDLALNQQRRVDF